MNEQWLNKVVERAGMHYLRIIIGKEPVPEPRRSITFMVPSGAEAVTDGSYDYSEDFFPAFIHGTYSNDHDTLEIIAFSVEDHSTTNVPLSVITVELNTYMSPGRNKIICFMNALNQLQIDHGMEIESGTPILTVTHSKSPCGYGLMNGDKDSARFKLSRPWGG